MLDRDASAGLLIVRLALGLIFLMHGWVKLFGDEISFMQEMLRMASWQIPDPVFLLLAVLAAPSGATAGAASGFGLSLDAADIVSKDSVTEQPYARATFGLGVDYQLALGESFSLGIIVAEASGDASFPTLPAVTFHTYSMVGLEARVWLGAWFLGYQKGTYVFVTT